MASEGDLHEVGESGMGFMEKLDFEVFYLMETKLVLGRGNSLC